MVFKAYSVKKNWR